MGVFEQACILSNESFLKTIPDVLPEPQYSRKHIRAMNRIINKMRNDRYHRLTTGTIKVLVVAAVILSLALTAFAIPSVREYIITQFKTHSVFRTVSTEDSQPVTDLTVGYIPEGFELVKEEEDELRLSCFYSRDNDWFIVEKTAERMETGFDTEKLNARIVVVDNIEYFSYTHSENSNGIVWCKDGYIYSVKGNISYDILITIAKTIT